MKTIAKHLLTISPGETLYRTPDTSLFVIFKGDNPLRLKYLYPCHHILGIEDDDAEQKEETLLEIVSLHGDLHINLELYRIDELSFGDVSDAIFNHFQSFKIEERYWKIFEGSERINKMQNPHLQFIGSFSQEKDKASLIALVHPVLN